MRRQPPVDAEQKHDKERLKREKAALQRRERERVEKLSKYDNTPLRF